MILRKFGQVCRMAITNDNIIRLTKARIDSFGYQGDGNSRDVRWDEKISGFGLRIYPSGKKSFVLSYRSPENGAKVLWAFAEYGPKTLDEARSKAQGYKGQIGDGIDPRGTERKKRSRLTIDQLCDRYLDQYAANKRSLKDDKSLINQRVRPTIGRMIAADVKFSHVQSLHHKLKDTPIRANRLLSLLSKMFNLAIRWEICESNPTTGIERYPENRRERFLSADEIQRLGTVLAIHPNQIAANAIRLLMLTGARRGEVLNATWEQFDLERGIWIKPGSHTKQKKLHRVPLSPAAIQVLLEMKQSYPGKYVFPGRNFGQPLKELKRFWANVCRDAELEGVRVNDIRHTYASILVSSGSSLPLIGALLGHTQPATTARYAHLYDDPLREATNRVGNLIIPPDGSEQNHDEGSGDL